MGTDITQAEDESLYELLIEIGKEFDPTKMLSIIDKSAKFFSARRERKFYQFNQKLFYNQLSDKEIENIKNNITSEDDYYSLLSAAINDEEEKKTTIYVTLYKNIADSTISSINKFKIMKILKSLTYSSLELIKKIYIYTQYEIREKNNRISIESFLSKIKDDPNYTFEIEALKQFGLLKIKNIYEKNALEQTQFCLDIAKLFFRDEELTPEAINAKYFIDKVTLLSDLSNNGSYEKIIQLLNTKSIKVSGVLGFTSDFHITSSHVIVCIIDNIDSATATKLHKIAKYKKVIKVSLQKHQNALITADISLDFANEESTKKFLSLFDIHIMKMF